MGFEKAIGPSESQALRWGLPMISNLRPRSNLLPFKEYQRCMRAISALDLYDMKRRCPNLGIIFDPAHYSLTPRQVQEWESHLFWGDTAISIGSGSRSTRWVDELQNELSNSWEQIRENLDEEVAFEVLLITDGLTSPQTGHAGQFQEIREHVLRFLNGIGYTVEDIEERICGIEGYPYQRHANGNRSFEDSRLNKG